MLTITNTYYGLDNFEPWSGAETTFENIKEAGKLEELETLLTDWYPDGIEEVQLNDILWFENDELYNALGMGEEE